MKTFLKKRSHAALFTAIMSMVFPAVIGALLALTEIEEYSIAFWNYTKGVYLLFGCALTLSAGFMIFTKIPLELCIGFGSGVYYGTILVCSLLHCFIDSIILSVILSLVIVSVITYFVWIKRVDPKI